MGTSSKYKAVSRHEYDEEWIKETWGWDTPEYFIRNQGRNLRPRIRTCLNLARLKPGMRVLDIGCGRGEIVLHCGRLGIDAYGVDYSKQALEIADKARLTHSSAEQDRMHFILDDVKNLEFRELFDRIFLGREPMRRMTLPFSIRRRLFGILTILSTELRLTENRSKCVCWVSTLVAGQLQMAGYRRLGRGMKPNKRLSDLNPTYNVGADTE